jgi:hypothetical protein
MPRFRVPVARPEPDAGAFIDCLMGRSHPARPPLVEYIVDEIMTTCGWRSPSPSRSAS